MVSAPGVRVVVARCWKDIFPISDDPEVPFTELYQFLQKDVVKMPVVPIDEYFEGAGSTCDDLAALVLQHIQVVLSKANPT
jgi:hypothetical protein